MVQHDRALYELMFRAEPRKHVSRSAFLTVMRRVYGFHIAPTEGLVDRYALQTLDEAGRICAVCLLHEGGSLPGKPRVNYLIMKFGYAFAAPLQFFRIFTMS